MVGKSIKTLLLFFNAHHFLVALDQPQPADAILVLSGCKEGEREAEGAKLYFEGYSDRHWWKEHKTRKYDS